MFEKPKPGSVVTFTVVYFQGLPMEKTSAEHNVTVVKSARWDNPNTFRIRRNTHFNPDGVIELKNVLELYINGHPATQTDQHVQHDQIEQITVKGSKGKQYMVTMKNGIPKSCTCTGFTYRGTCRHLSEAENNKV